MTKIIAITVLVIYLLIYYIALFVEPGMEKQWMQEERALNTLQENFVRGSRFLSDYGIFVTAFVIGVVAYLCATSGGARDANE